MSKDTVLITAGPVYGKLDDNKLVSNRSRGLWAARLVPHLLDRGYRVLLAVPDIALDQIRSKVPMDPKGPDQNLEFLVHRGYDEYADICYDVARDRRTKAAIMAAAVTNYIPKHPFKGKMPTTEKEISIPFVLAERVINRMKRMNPTMTLIGCKLLFSGDYDQLIDKAYGVVLEAKCNAVIANDGKLGLKRKFLVHQDKTVIEFADEFDSFYNHLADLIEDEHYSTTVLDTNPTVPQLLAQEAALFFNKLVDRYRDLFVRRQQGSEYAFGAVAVPMGVEGCLVSPREKGQMFSVGDAVVVRTVEKRQVNTWIGKASLNAPLLVRHLWNYPEAAGVVHFHDTYKPERSDGMTGPSDVAVAAGIDWACPVVPHAPPGTVRDNEREIPGPVYYIQGHGWIMAVDKEGRPIRSR